MIESTHRRVFFDLFGVSCRAVTFLIQWRRFVSDQLSLFHLFFHMAFVSALRQWAWSVLPWVPVGLYFTEHGYSLGTVHGRSMQARRFFSSFFFDPFLMNELQSRSAGVLTRRFFFSLFVLPHSMQPTLNPDSNQLKRDVVLFNHWAIDRCNYNIGDVVTLRYRNLYLSDL